jgi:hypothetical protein
MATPTGGAFDGSKASAHEYVSVFGRGDATTTRETVWGQDATDYPFPMSAQRIRIKAGGNANDTAAGTGARLIRIDGLDANLDEISEFIATAGASASAWSTNTFFRINNCVVATCGAYGGANEGEILVENETDLNVIADIEADEGRAAQAVYTVPNGMTAQLVRVLFHVEGNKSCTFRIHVRAGADTVTAPFTADIKSYEIDQLLGDLALSPAPNLIPGKADIWITAQMTSGTASVFCNMAFRTY